MMDEGYIKFNAQWEKGVPFPEAQLEDLQHWRQEMYQRQLIGAYPDGIGFGNISQRTQGDQFMISGSATGNFETLTAEHYALVTRVDIETNALECEGPIIASSESMSHAMVYRELDWVQGVIHIHSLEMWERLLHKVPTTDQSAAYGTPEMAWSIVDLIRTTDLPEQKIFVMEGHREGVFAFGKNLKEAAAVILKYEH